MPITYPIDFPTTFGATQASIDLIKAVAVSESEFSYSQQVQEHPGEAWEMSISLELLNRDQAEEYNAFILKLAGRVGTFTMGVPGSETPRGVATGTPLVKGTSQTGRDLIIDGMTPSTVGIFKAGDFIQLGSGSNTRLYKILDDADTDGAGEVTVLLAPKIVTAPADNDAVIVSNAKGLFRLRSNATPVSISAPNQHSLSFNAREVR